ncbi:hypothetical protein V8E36_001844, partial [Tilletia maclaganii]
AFRRRPGDPAGPAPPTPGTELGCGRCRPPRYFTSPRPRFSLPPPPHTMPASSTPAPAASAPATLSAPAMAAHFTSSRGSGRSPWCLPLRHLAHPFGHRRGRIAGRSILPVVPFGAKRVLPRPAPFHSASGSSLFHSAGAHEDLLWFRTAPIMPLASLGVNRALMARCDHSNLHLPALERCFIATRHCHMAHAMSLERLRLLSSAAVLFLSSLVALPSAHVHSFRWKKK